MGKSERINGFDALRTIAMWLGIVLHAIIAYKTIPEPGWPKDSAINLGVLDWLYDYIHLFRMPLFFMVAGFFTRLVIQRSGTKYFITQRYKRIVIPFVAGLIFIVPLTMLPFNFYRFYEAQHLPFDEAWSKAVHKMLGWNGLAHLWFLYYLILFYVVTLPFAWLDKKRGSASAASSGNNTAYLAVSAWLLWLLAILLYFFKAPVPPVFTGVIPHVFPFLYYGLFFGSGWLIEANRPSIDFIKASGIPLWAAGTIISVVLYAMDESLLAEGIRIFLASIMTFSLVMGMTGIFLKFFHAESRLWRYCSDAAYWVYLVHMGIVAGMQVWLIDSAVPPAFRLPLVLIVAFALSLLSYEYLVRYTFIGVSLHGKRTRPSKKELLQDTAPVS